MPRGGVGIGGGVVRLAPFLSDGLQNNPPKKGRNCKVQLLLMPEMPGGSVGITACRRKPRGRQE